MTKEPAGNALRIADAEERFAVRLAEDIERVLGVGIVIDDVEVHAGEGTATVAATLLIGDRVERIEAVGSDLIALYRPILQRAAEIRLRTAYWQMIGPA
jgi:hypothetical protein